MKNNKFSISICLAACVIMMGLISLSSCGNNEPSISKEDQVKAKLIASSWSMNSVTVDGTDRSSVYANLKVTFTSSGFTTLNGGVIWPASGTWSFTSADATSITRNDGLVVTLQEVTDTSLKLALTWSKTTLGPGRVESVSGQHVFSFTR